MDGGNNDDEAPSLPQVDDQQHLPQQQQQQQHLNVDVMIVGGSVSQPTSPSMSYVTDRETVLRSSSGHATVAETHLIRSVGSQSQSYTEEHWSSEITSFVAIAPPKFIQVIKAYRVLTSDTISLVVEVASDPPAIFEWFCNEKSVLQDRGRFQVGHGINISRLRVNQPEQGVYKCVTRNPAGVSTSYGYITVNSDRDHLSSSKEDVRSQRMHSVTYHQAPRFLTQVPNLFVAPGSHVIIDVEVDANPPARFSWFVNGREYRDSTHNVEMFAPDANRSVVRFALPVAGEYKVVASNCHGSAMSCGHVDIQRTLIEESIQQQQQQIEQQHEQSYDPMTSSLRSFGTNGRPSRQAVNLFELNYTQRSSSVPRGVRHLESHIEVANSMERDQRSETRNDAASIVEARQHHQRPPPPRGTSRRFLPEAPKFLTRLPDHVTLKADEKLVLTADVHAVPAAELCWNVNGFELKKSNNVVVLMEHNKSTLVIHPPVKQGKYKVTARNDIGSESMITHVQRIGEPIKEKSTEPPDIIESAVTVTCSHDDDAGSHSSFQTVKSVRKDVERHQETINELPEKDPIRSFIDATSPKHREKEHPFSMVLASKSNQARRDEKSPSAKNLPYPPRIINFPSESVFRILDGTPMKFRVIASSLPPATFLWMLNNFELRNNQNIRIGCDEANVSEIEFQKTPAGNLTVIARNQLGDDKWTGKVIIEYDKSPDRADESAEHHRQSLGDAVITEVLPTTGECGERIVIIVRFDEHRSGVCQFYWTINGQNVEGLDKVAVESTEYESSLIVESLHPEICGEVVCVVKNIQGDVFTSSACLTIRDHESSFEIVPPDLPEESAPKIVEPLHSAIFLDGQPMSLRCRITANPSAAIIWTKDDVNVDDWVINKDVTTSILDSGVCELLNPECFQEDSGLYKCTATNPHGTAETAAYINVEGLEYVKDREEAEISESVLTEDVHVILPPKFIEQLTSEIDNYQELGYIRLVATVQSSAPFTINWQKDGEKIENSSKYEIVQFADGAQILTIRNPQIHEDSAVYTCTVESEHGVSSSSCEVDLVTTSSPEFLDAPSPPTTEEIETEVQEVNMTFDVEVEDVKETGIDDDIEIVNREEVTGTAEIEKQEEEFKLLIKVADQVASTLVANVFLDAVREAVKKLVESEDEEEENGVGKSEGPQFETRVDEYHVKENGTVKMFTTISGHPTPFLEWYFGEKKLTVTENISMSYESGTSSITMKNVQKDQAGVYYLHATNCHGTAVLSMKLVVDTCEVVTHVLDAQPIEEAENQAPTEIDERRLKHENEEKNLRAAAEKISEQFAQLWMNDAVAEVENIRIEKIKNQPEVEKISQNIDAIKSCRTPSPTSYDQRIKTIESNLLKVSSQETLEPIEATNILLNTALSLKDSHVSDETTTVVVSQQPQNYEQIVTVIESNIECHALRLSTTTSVPLKFIDFDTILQKPGTSCESIDKLLVQKSKKTANAQHRIVVLQGMSNTFHNAITWSLKKVKRLVGEAEAKAYADVEVVKQDEANEQIMTIIDNETIVPQLLQVAAAANKLKLENVSVALIREGDRAHQELVIEYESSIDEPIDANTSHLLFQKRKKSAGPEEHVWTRPSKFNEDEAHVVAVFVEVDANCPDQNVEIVATVNSAFDGEPEVEKIAIPTNEDDQLTEVSQSLATESSGAPQAPKFLRMLANCYGRIGEAVQLKCVVAGMPTPEIEWTIDGDPITANDEYEIVYEDGVCILRIIETLMEDEGEYCCTAINTAGSTSTKCFLKLSEREDDAVDLLRQLSEIKLLVDEEPLTPSNENYAVMSSQFNSSDNNNTMISNAVIDEAPPQSLTTTVTRRSEMENERGNVSPPVTASFNDDMMMIESFKRFNESAETTVKVTELCQSQSVGGKFRQKSTTVASAATTSTTNLMLCNQNINNHESVETQLLTNNSKNIRLSVSSSTPSWDFMTSDPFPGSDRVQINENEAYEPRVPLLPQKMLYKGHEIFANSVEKDQKDQHKSGGVENLNKCVETLLQFGVDVDVPNSAGKKEKSKNPYQDRENRMRIIEQIAKQVEAELSNISQSKSKERKEIYEENDLKEIEKAIFCISDQLATQKSVSKAQADANEELLRLALAEMILKNKSSKLIKEKVKTIHPIEKLQEKISEIENNLLEDTEVTEILNRKGDENDKRKAIRIKRAPSAHSARITPITTTLRDRLIQLHQMTISEESANRQNQQDADDIHKLFVKIEQEINTIAGLCKEKMTKQGAETVTHVLNSVLQHVASIINVIRVAQDLQPIDSTTLHNGSEVISSSNNNNNEVTVWYSFQVRPESEDIIGIVDEEPTNKRPPSTPMGGSRRSSRRLSPTIIESLAPTPIAPPRKRRSQSTDIEHLETVKDQQRIESIPVRPPRSKSRVKENAVNEPIAPPRNKSRQRSMLSAGSGDDELQELKTSTLSETMNSSTSCVHIQKSSFSFTNLDDKKEGVAVIVNVTNEASTESVVPVFDDIASIQMLCEESDYPSDTDRSLLLSGTVRFFNRTSPSMSEQRQFLDVGDSVSLDLRSQRSGYDGDKSENVEDVYVNVELTSMPSMSSLNAINQQTSEKTSLNHYPSVKESDPTKEEEEEEEVTTDLSFVAKSVISSETLDVVLEEGVLSQMNGSTTDRAISTNTIRETDILSDESMTVDLTTSIKEKEINEHFSLIKKASKRRVTGVVVHTLLFTISASVTADNTFDVDVVQEPQRYNISIKVIEDIIDFTSLTIMSDDCDDDCEEVSSDVFNLLSPQSSQHLQARSYDDVSIATTRTGITISIVARSLNDGIYASLEEIAWGEVEMTVPDVMQMSMEEMSKQSSVQFNVTVSETNLEEAKSLKSQVSFKSSQNSLSEMDNTVSSSGTISIPSYVVKLESTATITCELNNYLPKQCVIDWYCGKSKIIIDNEQFDRISHDLLEVLIIRSIEQKHGNLYSLKINDDLFPVAYLIVENSASSSSATFLTRPETQFVMEGQPTVISCQVDNPSVNVTWLKDRRPLHENPRIKLETDGNGTHRILIPHTLISDQGTYLALTSSQSVSITLVVEERIDEKEVMVIPSGTESEEDDVQEYLVPPGSTATIACELEECEQKRAIRWLRDGKDIKFESGKIEHVQNGLKHYLVVHDATSVDSGLYSVCISDVEFRVAHLCVNSVASTLHALKAKRISNNSLH